MENPYEWFLRLKQFVPIANQTSTNQFMLYLKSIPQGRIHIELTSITIDFRGIDIVQHRARYTEQQFFTWREIQEHIVKPNFKETAPLGQLEFQGLIVQLDNAF